MESTQLSSNKGEGPLGGVRVLDLGTMLAGPMAATLLADFGADVIKVEKPDGGDTLRSIGPFCEGESLQWNVDNRNKKSVTIDLRLPEGQALVLKMCEHVDVIVENFRPGTLARWGLDYATIQKTWPHIVMLSVSGFGQTGPYAERAAYDRIATAFGGLMYVTGFADRPPVRIGVSMADYLTGLFGAYAVSMALYRQKTSGGPGQHIDLSLYESIFRFTDSMVPAFDKLSQIRERKGNLGLAGAPGDHFLTSDGRYLVLTVSNNAMFSRLCHALGQPELAHDEKYASHDLRWQNIEELNAIVGGWIRTHPVADVEAALSQAGVAYSLVYSMADIFSDPHYKARGSIQAVATDSMGKLCMPGVGPKFSLTPAPALHRAPRLGEHTSAVLEGLGLSSVEIDGFRARGII